MVNCENVIKVSGIVSGVAAVATVLCKAGLITTVHAVAGAAIAVLGILFLSYAFYGVLLVGGLLVIGVATQVIPIHLVLAALAPFV